MCVGRRCSNIEKRCVRVSIALCVQMKAAHQEVCERLEGALADQQSKYNAVASDLLRTDGSVHDLEVRWSSLNA